MFKKLLLFVFASVFIVMNNANAKKEEKPDLLLSKVDIVNYNWWLKFNDINLNEYILEALKNNSDSNIATLKLEEYNQFVKASFGAELPALTASVDAFKIHKSPIPSALMDDNGINLPLTASYELDLFLKNRDKTKSTKKQYEAYEAQVKSIYVSLVSNVASVYFNLVKINKIIELQEEILNIRKGILADLMDKYNKGVISEIDLNNAKQDIKAIEIEISNTKQTRTTLATQFCVLLGRDPTSFNELRISDYKNIRMEAFYTEMSTDTIFSRPDVIAVEKQMEKAKIDIRVARKEFLPSINLTGSLNWSTLTSGGFFSPKNTIGMLMASIGGDLFTGGRKMANLNIMKSRYEQMLENYKKVTLEAIKEVNDSLYTIKYSNEATASNSKSYDLERQNFNHYNRMYKNGLISYSDLKKYEQKSVSAEMNLVSAKIQDYISYVGLYKAVGGKLEK